MFAVMMFLVHHKAPAVFRGTSCWPTYLDCLLNGVEQCSTVIPIVSVWFLLWGLGLGEPAIATVRMNYGNAA